jgi:hypothetical protein
MEDLGGDGSIGRYDGVIFTALGSLRRRRRHGGARRGGAPLYWFPARSHRIKWRIEASIALVSGSVILPFSVSCPFLHSSLRRTSL